MKKQRYSLRDIPDTVINLVKTLVLAEENQVGYKVNASAIVVKAIAQLGGYIVCPDCNGIIEPEIFNVPPENVPENKKLWTEIGKQHTASCSWLRVAKSGAFKAPVKVEPPEISKDVKEAIEYVENRTTKDNIEIKPPIKETVKSEIANTELIPANDDVQVEEEPETKVVYEMKDGIKIKKIVKTATVDESDKADFKAEAGSGSTMSTGLIPEGNKGTKRDDGGRITKFNQGGKTTEKSGDNTLIRHKVKANEPEPSMYGKARVEKLHKDNVGLTLDDIPFEE